jgi:hypothetical protein
VNDLKRHAKTMLHTKNEKSVTQQPSVCHIFRPSIDQQVCKAELKFAYMLAEHNLPMLLSDHASRLFSGMFPDSQIAKSYKSARTKTTALITNAISPELHEDVVHHMQANYFSLLVDESTDISITQHLAVLLRIYDDDAGIVRTKFYKLLNIPKADAKTLFGELEKSFTTDDIGFTNTVGFGSDGASVMVGRRNSFLSQLKEKQPYLFNIHCICHVAHLFACKIPKEIEQLFIIISVTVPKDKRHTLSFKHLLMLNPTEF